MVKYNDFQTVLINITRALKPNGYFLFDMVTSYELSTQWDDTVRHENNGNISLVLNSKYDKKTRLAKLTCCFLIKDEKKVKQYIRHFQNKAYTKKEIKQALKNSHLRLLNQYQCFAFEPPHPKSGRIFYITQRKD